MKKTLFSVLAMAALIGQLHAQDTPGVVTEEPPIGRTSDAILTEARPGEAVELKSLDLTSATSIAYTQSVLPGPQYIISDDPEYIRIPEGVALREEVEPGEVRLYVYNVNGVKEPEKIDRKISVVVDNLGTEELRVEFIRGSFDAPSGNYFGVAKNALAGYFKYPDGVRALPTVTIPAGGSAPLDARMDTAISKYDDLVHGLYEFRVNQPARISVVQTAPETSSVEASSRIKEVIESPRKNAGRGKFEISNYSVKARLDPAAGIQELIVADGKNDPWVRGVDGSTGAELELKGNYGIMYEIEIERVGDGRPVALVTYNARFGSQWCGGMANTMKVSDGYWPGGVVSIPADKLMTRSAPEVVVIQTFPPLASGKTDTIKLTYSPPGASCLPTPLVFIPFEIEK